jgi:hypothetical protein
MANQKYKIADVIKAIEDTKGLLTMAARRLGCSTETIRTYAKKFPTVQEAIDTERARMTDIAELALYKQIQDGQGWAVCFYLKTQGKDRGYVERTEHRHGGDPDNPTPIEQRGTFTIQIDSRRGEDADDEQPADTADL